MEFLDGRKKSLNVLRALKLKSLLDPDLNYTCPIYSLRLFSAAGRLTGLCLLVASPPVHVRCQAPCRLSYKNGLKMRC